MRFAGRYMIINMAIESEELEFILGDISFHIDDLIIEVLEDDKSQPEHSAVYVSNLIKCYIEVMQDIGKPEPYDSVHGYFKFFRDEEDYQAFEKSRKKESEYYIGKQY